MHYQENCFQPILISSSMIYCYCCKIKQAICTQLGVVLQEELHSDSLP